MKTRGFSQVPKFEKLSPAEVEQMKRRRTPTLDLSEYQAYLETLRPGDWGAVSLEEGESQRAVKRRLTTASKQMGREIKYKKSREGRIIFEVK